VTRRRGPAPQGRRHLDRDGHRRRARVARGGRRRPERQRHRVSARDRRPGHLAAPRARRRAAGSRPGAGRVFERARADAGGFRTGGTGRGGQRVRGLRGAAGDLPRDRAGPPRRAPRGDGAGCRPRRRLAPAGRDRADSPRPFRRAPHMTSFQSLVLGVVQGVTEFLPISSTAHLRIVPALLGWGDPGAAYTAVLQLGSLLAVVGYFLPELWKMVRAALAA